MSYEFSKELAFEACSLVYRKWTEAYDNLKKERESKNDGSRDWEAFHNMRLDYAIKEEARLKKLVDEAAPINSRILGLS